MVKDLVGAAFFGDDSAVHEKYPVRNLFCEPHLMSYDHCGHSGLYKLFDNRPKTHLSLE